MRRGRKLCSKNIRAWSSTNRPAASARRHTCMSAKDIDRFSPSRRFVRNRRRQLAKKVAKAAAWSSVLQPLRAFHSIGSRAELGSPSGSGWSDGIACTTNERAGKWNFGGAAPWANCSERRSSGATTATATTVYRQRRYVGTHRPASFRGVARTIKKLNANSMPSANRCAATASRVSPSAAADARRATNPNRRIQRSCRCFPLNSGRLAWSLLDARKAWIGTPPHS